MIHPVFIDHAQQHDALQLTHDRGGKHFLLGVIELCGGFEETLSKIVRAHAGKLGSGNIRCTAREVHAFTGLECIGIGFGGELSLLADSYRNMIFNARAEHIEYSRFNIKSVKHLLALTVDDLTLLVHHVVVLQRRLTGLEVAGFHARLRVFNGLREHLVLDGHILVDIKLFHEACNALTAEKAHQIIVEREVEARLAGVTLTAGTAAELIVNTAGIVTLRADDEQTAGLAHLVRFAGNFRLVLFQRFGKHGACIENFLIFRFGIAGRLGDQLIGKSCLAQIVLCHVLRIAAEHDIRAAACHVGGNGNGTELTGLRDDLSFLLMILGVEQIVLDALAGKQV